MPAISKNTVIPAGVLTTVLDPIPAGQSATVEINVCHTGAAVAKVRVAITDNPAAPTVYIEYDTSILRTPLLRTGQVVKAGESVVVLSDTAGCQVRVSGFQEGEV